MLINFLIILPFLLVMSVITNYLAGDQIRAALATHRATLVLSRDACSGYCYSSPWSARFSLEPYLGTGYVRTGQEYVNLDNVPADAKLFACGNDGNCTTLLRQLSADKWFYDAGGSGSRELLLQVPSFRQDIKLQLSIWTPAANDVVSPVTRIAGNTFHYTLYVILVVALIMALYPLAQWLVSVFGKTSWPLRDVSSRYLLGGGILVVAVFALVEAQPLAVYYFYYISEHSDQLWMFGNSGDFSLVLSGLATVIVGLFSKNVSEDSKLLSTVRLYAMAVVAPLLLWLVYLTFTSWVVEEPPLLTPGFVRDIARGETATLFITVAAAVFIITRLFYDINKMSLHPFYRDRLSKAYLMDPWRLDKNNEVLHNDGQTLQDLDARFSPYHLINTTLNIPKAREGNLLGRNADFFIFSKEYVGSPLTGYCRTRDYVKKDKGLRLASAMAISGAAAAPNMGRITIPSLVFIMALLNIRLGYWARNPVLLSKKRKFFGGFSKLLTLGHVGPLYLIREMFSDLDEKDNFVNLTDGGHLENMGIYELVRRHCRFIICGDAEADPDMAFTGLSDSIRQIQTDMGIKIDIDVGPIREVDGVRKTHFAVGTIHYPEGDGRLLYCKSSLTGDENVYIQEYKANNSDFPHQTTADQFFDEKQFEAYRALGYHIGQDVESDPAGKRFLDDLKKFT